MKLMYHIFGVLLATTPIYTVNVGVALAKKAGVASLKGVLSPLNPLVAAKKVGLGVVGLGLLKKKLKGKDEECEVIYEEKTTPHCSTTYEQKCVEEYKEECSTEYTTDCSEEYVTDCKTEYEEKCSVEYSQECTTEHEKERHDEYQQECTTSYQDECADEYINECKTDYKQECHDENLDECRTEYKQECHEEYKEECSMEYAQTCTTEYVNECTTEYKEQCFTGQEQVCQDVPDCQTTYEEECTVEYEEYCEDVHGSKNKQQKILDHRLFKRAVKQDFDSVEAKLNKVIELEEKLAKNEAAASPERLRRFAQLRKVFKKPEEQKVCHSIPREVCHSVPKEECS